NSHATPDRSRPAHGTERGNAKTRRRRRFAKNRRWSPASRRGGDAAPAKQPAEDGGGSIWSVIRIAKRELDASLRSDKIGFVPAQSAHPGATVFAPWFDRVRTLARPCSHLCATWCALCPDSGRIRARKSPALLTPG